MTAPFEVVRCTPDDAAVWDAAAQASPIATFMHQRAYLDYHRDRFADHSLILRAAGRVRAVLPAHERDGALYSHRGITFGGLLTMAGAGVEEAVGLVGAVRAYCAAHGLRGVWMRPVPFIYHAAPDQAVLYALTAHGARLYDRHVLHVLALPAGKFGGQRERGLKRAAAAGVQVREVFDEAGWAAFWAMNALNLRERHAAEPVHSFAEIWRLHTAFPHALRLFTTDHDPAAGMPHAGVLVYETPVCAKSQYIASTAHGRAIGALDAVFAHLLRGWNGQPAVYALHRWFDFGSSHTDDVIAGPEGQARTFGVNTGLVAQKEGFGAHPITLDSYWLDALHTSAERPAR